MPFFWVPRDRLEEREHTDRVPYLTWHKQGLIEAPAGRAIDKLAIIHKLVLAAWVMIGIDAQRLAAAVIESGMGEVQICARAGVAHQTFAKMLKGQMVRFPSIGRICNILNLRPAEILREVPGG